MPQQSEEMHALGKELKRRFRTGETIKFVLYQNGHFGMMETILLTNDVFDTMIECQVFDLGESSFRVKDKSQPAQIDMYFGDSRHSISGFPRCFFDNDATQPAKATRYLHTTRGPYKTEATWIPPDLRRSPSRSNLKKYMDLTRALGDDGLDTDKVKKPDLVPGTSEDGEDQDGPTAIPKKNSGIPGAFRNLVLPLGQRKTEGEVAKALYLSGVFLGALSPNALSPRPTSPISTSPRATSPSGLSNGNASDGSDERFPTAPQQYFYEDPEDHEVYRQWLAGLQSSQPDQIPRWVPRLSRQSLGVASFPPSLALCEMLGDTTMPVEADSMQVTTPR